MECIVSDQSPVVPASPAGRVPAESFPSAKPRVRRRLIVVLSALGLLAGSVWTIANPYAELQKQSRDYARFHSATAAHPEWRVKIWQSGYLALVDPRSGDTRELFPYGADRPPQPADYAAIIVPLLLGLVVPVLLVYAMAGLVAALKKAGLHSGFLADQSSCALTLISGLPEESRS